MRNNNGVYLLLFMILILSILFIGGIVAEGFDLLGSDGGTYCDP